MRKNSYDVAPPMSVSEVSTMSVSEDSAMSVSEALDLLLVRGTRWIDRVMRLVPSALLLSIAVCADQPTAMAFWPAMCLLVLAPALQHVRLDIFRIGQRPAAVVDRLGVAVVAEV